MSHYVTLDPIHKDVYYLKGSPAGFNELFAVYIYRINL